MNVLPEKSHEILMKMRKEMKINGVTEVESFDETGAVLHTVCGMMTVEGTEIRIGILDVDSGNVTLNGRIDAIFYSSEEKESKRSIFGKKNR